MITLLYYSYLYLTYNCLIYRFFFIQVTGSDRRQVLSEEKISADLD